MVTSPQKPGVLPVTVKTPTHSLSSQLALPISSAATPGIRLVAASSASSGPTITYTTTTAAPTLVSVGGVTSPSSAVSTSPAAGAGKYAITPQVVQQGGYHRQGLGFCSGMDTRWKRILRAVQKVCGFINLVS